MATVGRATLWIRRAGVGLLVGVLPPVALVQVAAAGDRTARRGEVPEPTGAVAPSVRVATPLLSARRVPTVAARVDPVRELAALLEPLRADVSQPGCLRVTVGGATVFDERGATAAIPASTTKLVTAAVALDVLGPDTTFRTDVLTVGPPDAAGSVAGDLFVVGGGDPLLSTQAYRDAQDADPESAHVPATSLEALADTIVAAGVKAVTGAVVGDDGRYDRTYYVAQWNGAYRDVTVGPSSALAVNDGFARIPRAGGPAADPPAATAARLTELLKARGVTVGQAPRSGATPKDATSVAHIDSQPMTAVVHELLSSSDNDTAELLLKEIGRTAKGQGSTAGGLAVVAEKLASWGVPMDGVQLLDGSGLSRDDRISCAALVTLLARYPLDSALARGLPVAGVEGTLVGNLKGTVAEGRLRAKTGTLTGVRTLAGFFPTADGTEPLRFAYMLQRPGVSSPDTAVDPYWLKLVNTLATFPARPDLTPFLPRPALG